MPRIKKSLTPQSQWTLILVGAFCFVYIGTHWYNFFPVKEATYGTVASVIHQAGGDVLEIPALNIAAPIVYSKETKEDKIQIELQRGVVHLAETSLPGQVGNSYIVGHSSNYKNAPGAYNDVFKNLPKIQIGDRIIIEAGNQELIYQVTETHIVQPTELWVMSQETNGEKILSLQTSYPVGTANKRFVVVSKLLDNSELKN